MDGVKMAICGYESLYFCKRHCRKGEARFAGKGGFPCRTHIDHADVPCKYHVKRLLAALLESEEYMKKKVIAWACRTCNKVDWADQKEQTAKPEHVCHRGIDLGTCKGEMIPLYAESE